MSGFLVHHQLPELAQTHVHRVCDAIQPLHPLSSSSPAFNLSQHQGLLQWISSSHGVAKVLEFQHQYFQWILIPINFGPHQNHTKITVKRSLFNITNKDQEVKTKRNKKAAQTTAMEFWSGKKTYRQLEIDLAYPRKPDPKMTWESWNPNILHERGSLT